LSDPAEIDSSETIVRVLRTPQFVRKAGKLHASAWRPQRDKDCLSVVRWLCREQPGTAFKARCLLIGNNGPNSYCGVAVVNAGDCIEAGTRLECAPDEYPGHAHIVFPFSVAFEEPQEGENFRLQVEMSLRLLKLATYLPDPQPAADGWTIQHESLPA